MIPAFPQCRSLRADDRAAVEALTGHLPPYSDFNFTSLWCWDVTGAVRISQLNGSLVVRFSDYVTGEPFYSFCGGFAAAQTVAALLDNAQNEGLARVLKLLPQESISDLSDAQFRVSDDPGNFDYILCLDQMSSFPGRPLQDHRNYARRFRRENHTITEQLDLTASTTRDEIDTLLSRWALRKQLSPEDIHNEFTAIRRLFDHPHAQELLAFGVFESERLIGLSVSEILSDGYAMLHFEKADRERIGLYSYIMQETARHLTAHGCRHLNYQQDLGIIGLRKCKSGYRPSMFLKKYQVTNVA